MADRTMVRQGPVVSFSLVAVLVFAALGPGPDGSSSAPTPAKDKPIAIAPAKVVAIAPEKKPYKIKAWLSVDPRARVDGRGRETLIAGWKTMVKRFVGPPWELEIAEGDGPLATNELEAITPEMVIPQAKGSDNKPVDKAWLFRIEPANDGITISGREFDSATAQVGLLCRRPALVLADGPRALLQLSLDVFAASSEILPADPAQPKKRKIRVQGAMVPAATPIGQVVSVGSVFRPSRIFYKPEGGIQQLVPITSTYLLVESIENGIATCSIESGLGNPLTDKAIRAKLVGVGLKPASIPTRIRFTFLNTEGDNGSGVKVAERPAAGYTVVARPVPDGSPREVGTTDRDGRILLAPGFAEGLVTLRLMAAGTEPLLQFPVMPGEMVGEKLMEHIDPKGRTVTAETDLYALRDEILDLIAVRVRLESRMKSRANAENWSELRLILDEFKALPSKEVLEARLTKIDEDLSAEAKKNPRLQVRTKTVQGLIKETKDMVGGYLDDETYKSYEVGYQESQVRAATEKSGKVLPKMPTIGVKPAATTGIAASGPMDFAPAGAGFTVLMPGPPSESSFKTVDNASEGKTYKIAMPGKGVFSANYWDYPVAIAGAKVQEVMDNERDRLVAALPGAKITRQTLTTVSGLEAKEIEFEGPPGRTGEVPTIIAKIVLLNSRVISVSVGGSKALVSAGPATEFLASLKITTRGGQAAAAPVATPKATADPATSTSGGAANAIQKAQKKAAAPPAKAAGGAGTPF